MDNKELLIGYTENTIAADAPYGVEDYFTKDIIHKGNVKYTLHLYIIKSYRTYCGSVSTPNIQIETMLLKDGDYWHIKKHIPSLKSLQYVEDFIDNLWNTMEFDCYV